MNTLYSLIIAGYATTLSPLINIHELQHGDIIFVSDNNGNLSNAISDVTQTKLKTNYSHVGIIEKNEKNIFLYHSAPHNGTEKLLLASYIEQQPNKIIDVYRIVDKSINWQQIFYNANQYLGQPYNFTYILNDSSLYCSDYILRIINDSTIFNYEPMTFIDPKTDTFHQQWVNFYQKLNINIPEGEPGCNPNGMAQSPYLRKVGTLMTK